MTRPYKEADRDPIRVRPPRIYPPAYLLVAILGMVALHLLLPGATFVASPWRWLGLVTMVAALTLGASAARLFSQHQTTIKPGEASSHMLTTGPYRFTRNPIYVGMTLILAGLAVFLGSLTPWLVVPLFVYLIDRNIIPVEEKMLEDTFGEHYRQYCGIVRRWL
jgi:protein-S-isoprenylcysteine O-methyltransferase Ste14